MSKLVSTKYSASSFNTALLFLRLSVGILMMMHGYDKLIHFAQFEVKFMNFLGLGQSTSLALTIFAEFFCSIFLILGLFTRLATIPLIVATCVMVFMAHKGEVFGQAQTAALFLTSYIVILFLGAGKASVDGMIGK